MGVPGDCEPPLKRVKLFQESDAFPPKFLSNESQLRCLRNSMARTLISSQEDSAAIGRKKVIKRTEFVKIITKALYSLGYEKTGALLEEESGIPLHSHIISLLIQQITNRKWDQTINTLHQIPNLPPRSLTSASFLLLEQKFIDLVASNNSQQALVTLRKELSPLKHNFNRIRELSSHLISPLPLKQTLTSTILSNLQQILTPDILIPDNRLEQLVEKALDTQRNGCVFHNTLHTDFSLFSDHKCGRQHLPSKTTQVLDAHTDEVWYVKFSQTGRFLASGSKDKTAIIWEVGEDGIVFLKHKLLGHTKPVSFISWSTGYERVLTCGQEEAVRCWDAETGNCLAVYEKPGAGLVSCGWYSDSGVFAGVNDKSICLWDVSGKEVHCWKGHCASKFSDMAVTRDGSRIITACQSDTLVIFDWEAKRERFIEEDEAITSFTLSSDGSMLLVNLANQEIRLWSVGESVRAVGSYAGLTRTRFVIRSCFGGAGEGFVASGSEDSQVYVWHRGTGELLWVLPGHAGAVNCVSWNERNVHMMASCSDDRTVRIWGLKFEGEEGS